MHLDMAVNEEVGAKIVSLCPFRSVIRMLAFLELFVQQKHRRRDRFHDKGFGRTNAAHVDRFVRKSPALPMGMEVVPIHTEVEVEDVPSDALPRMRNDRRRVADKGATVEA